MSSHFDDEALRAAYEPVLRESTTTHGPECPTENELLSAVRGNGEEAERLRVLDHALECSACRRELALLYAVSSTETRAGAAAAPMLVTPADGAVVDAGLVRFAWQPMAGAIQYTLEVDATDGTVIFSSPTRDTTVKAPIAPTAAGENRWLIRATLEDGSEKRSETWVLKVQ
jgi:hypothetical protein